MRWENRVLPLLLLLGFALVMSLPLWASLLGEELVEPPAGSLLFRTFQVQTGYAGLALVMAVLSLSLRRLKLPWLRSLPRSRGLHILLGLIALLVVVAHAGGTWGSHVHGWLVASLLGAVFIALLGKLIENRCIAAHSRGASQIRVVWLSAHLVVVVAFMVLLFFHVLAVYYY